MKTSSIHRNVLKKVMLYKQNPLTGDWLCFIPETPQAYYCSTEKEAEKFCYKINQAFEAGELKFDDKGRVVITIK